MLLNVGFNQCLMTQCDFTVEKNTEVAMLAGSTVNFSFWTLSLNILERLKEKEKSQYLVLNTQMCLGIPQHCQSSRPPESLLPG